MSICVSSKHNLFHGYIKFRSEISRRHLATLIHSQTAKHLFEEWASIRRRLDYLKGWSLGAPVTRQSLLRYHRLAGIQRIIFQDWVINGLHNLTAKS